MLAVPADVRAENEHHRSDKQFTTSNAQNAADKPDNDAEREASAKVKRPASGDHLRVLKRIGDLEKD